MQFIKNCTFQPNLLSSNNKLYGGNFSPRTVHEIDYDLRSPEQFYEDQMEFQKNREEKLNLKKEQIKLEQLKYLQEIKKRMKDRR